MSVCRLNPSWHIHRHTAPGFWLWSGASWALAPYPKFALLSLLLGRALLEAVARVSGSDTTISCFLEDKLPWTPAGPPHRLYCEMALAHCFRVKGSLSIRSKAFIAWEESLVVPRVLLIGLVSLDQRERVLISLNPLQLAPLCMAGDKVLLFFYFLSS